MEQITHCKRTKNHAPGLDQYDSAAPFGKEVRISGPGRKIQYNKEALRHLIAIGLFVLSVFSCRTSQPIEKPDSISISVPYEVDVLDPHAKTRLSNYAASSNFYEPLVGTDAGNKILPRLARS